MLISCQMQLASAYTSLTFNEHRTLGHLVFLIDGWLSLSLSLSPLETSWRLLEGQLQMANWFHAHAAAAAAAPMGGAGTPQGQTAKPVWSTNRIATALWELFGTLVQNENETAYITTSQRTSHAIWCDSSNGNSAAPFSAPKVWFCRPQAIARSWLIWLHRTAQYEVVVLLPHRHGFSTQRSSWSCQGLACQVVLWDLRLLVV